MAVSSLDLCSLFMVDAAAPFGFDIDIARMG